MEATIASKNGYVTFVQTWTMESEQNQENWLATMERRVVALTGKAGFVSISLHRSEDGKRIAVYAQWRTAADLAAASDASDAKAGRAELDLWGTPDGAVYRVAAVHGPSNNTDAPRSYLPSQQLVSDVAARWRARGFKTRFVKTNGATLHIAESGQGEPIMLLHGYPQSGEIWRLIAEQLAKDHHVIIPDLRGMGLSEATTDGYELPNIAEDLHEIASILGYKAVSVIGHDWGGASGAVYALRYPKEVSKLAFIESALPGAGFEEMWTFAKPNGLFTFIPFLLMGEEDLESDSTAELIAGREEIFLEHLWRSFTGDPAKAPFIQWQPYIEAMRRPGVARSAASYYRSAYRSADAVRALTKTKLAIPVLSIAGEKGIGEMHQKLVEAFAGNVSATIVPGAGHFVAEERPQELLSALQKFLR
jgi:pimeloyl-ACP methyl ester carboxylesterase